MKSDAALYTRHVICTRRGRRSPPPVLHPACCCCRILFVTTVSQNVNVLIDYSHSNVVIFRDRGTTLAANIITIWSKVRTQNGHYSPDQSCSFFVLFCFSCCSVHATSFRFSHPCFSFVSFGFVLYLFFLLFFVFFSVLSFFILSLRYAVFVLFCFVLFCFFLPGRGRPSD